MPIGFCVRLAATAIAGLLGAATVAAAQESVEQFYKGKQISVVVGSSPGGGYDTYARLLARHFGNAIPGNPTVVVQNMSGAGSNRAAGYIYSVAPKDGTAIGAIFPGAVLQPLLSDVPVQHDPNKLVYLGSANSDVYVCYVRSDARGEDIQGRARQGADHRRQQSGRHHLRPAAAAQQRARHQVPHRHRLSGQPRDHASRSSAARCRAPAASAGPASR